MDVKREIHDVERELEKRIKTQVVAELKYSIRKEYKKDEAKKNNKNEEK